MSFCSKTDFIGDINLPAEFLNSDRFDAFLLKYEKTILIKLLGYDLYKKFLDGLDEVNPLDIEQKWLNLRDGVEYQDLNSNGLSANKYYSGIVDILKYFMYFFISDAIQSELTITGEVSAKNENSIISSPAPRVTGLWNDGVENVMDCKSYIEWYNKNNTNSYPTFEFSDRYFRNMNIFSI
jgi:hypothetical protein